MSIESQRRLIGATCFALATWEHADIWTALLVWIGAMAITAGME